MRSAYDRKILLGLIENVWGKYPELRLCQLFTMIVDRSGWRNNDLFYLEDEQLSEGLQKIIEDVFSKN